MQNSVSKNVRVRFAPSPTGWLHLGGARTALINYLFAKNQKGTFVLRVEDTDVERGNDTFLKQQLEDLEWLGLNWDEGPCAKTLVDKGSYGPYRQSKRLSLYQKYAKELINSNKAYYCFLTDEEIEEIKKEALKNKKPFRVESPYREGDRQSAEERIKKGDKAVVRFKVPKDKKQYVINDIVRGEVSFPSDMVGDFVLLRSSGLPVYNFSCAIDDYSMKISHAFRSEEHLANTIRQLMIFEAFSWSPPRYGHLSIILGEDHKKLSKRHGSVSCSEYRKLGYLPLSLLNFLSLMGWNPKTTQEIFSLSALISCFSLEGLNSSPGIFDKQKLDWINSQHLKAMTDEELLSCLKPFLSAAHLQFSGDDSWWKRVISSLRDSFTSFPVAVDVLRCLSENDFKLHPTSQDVLEWPSTLPVLNTWESFLQSYKEKEISKEVFSKACEEIKKETQIKGKFLFMPIRTAILGQPQGVELKTIIPLMKRSILLERVSFIKRSLKK